LLVTELGPGSLFLNVTIETLPVSFPGNTLRYPLLANLRFPFELPRTFPLAVLAFPSRPEKDSSISRGSVCRAPSDLRVPTLELAPVVIYRGTSRRWCYPAEDTARRYAWFAFARVRATDWLASRLGPADPHLSTSLRFPPAHPLCRSTCLFPADQTIAYDQVARVNFRVAELLVAYFSWDAFQETFP
jgi:hypothetical protein